MHGAGEKQNNMSYDKSNIRIVFMGTPEIAAVSLRGLIDDGYNVVGVITNPDKPTGRKKILTPSPVKAFALERGIPVYQPVKIRLEYDFLEPLKPDVIVTLAYGQIVPQAVLDCPKRGCINLHGSLLPKYRGAAPMQAAILNGEKETGVTLMEMVAAMDAGAMFDKIAFPIEESDDYGSVYEKMSLAAKELILKDLIPYMNGQLPGQPQDESLVTIAGKIKPEDEHLNLALQAEPFLRLVKALSPTPGGYLFYEGAKFKILKGTLLGSSNAPSGTLVKEGKKLCLAVSGRLIRLDVVQPEGKKPMDGTSFLNGHPESEGKILQ